MYKALQFVHAITLVITDSVVVAWCLLNLLSTNDFCSMVCMFITNPCIVLLTSSGVSLEGV